ncbi:MAG: AI-2E family transporter [Gallionella sp.]|nr:AI-2E family transporter [Gallionella sp.]
MTSPRFAAVQWLSFIVVLGAILYLLSPILTPFVAAAILAYICNPSVQRLVRLKTPPTLAVLLVMLALLVASVLLVLILLPLLEKELGNMSARLPQFIDALRLKLLPHLQQILGVTPAWDGAWLKDFAMSHWQSAGGMAGKVLPWLSNSGGFILELFANLILIPVAMFYLLRDWTVLVAQVDELIPRPSYDKVQEIATEIDAVLAEFLRGQLSVMVLMSVYYVIVLWLVGLEFALPIGIVAGMLVFVPYLGMLVGLALATLAAVMQFTSLSDVVWVWAVFALGQVLEGMVVTPRLVGERVGLHPLAVIFALMAFGQLMGFFGILLALPLSAILLVGLRHGKLWYLSSSMYRAP